MSKRLSHGEILRVVNYIGVAGGYLGDFSYRTHEEFYPVHCDLEIDVAKYRPATTREAFVQILRDAEARDQAKILRGVLDLYPPDSSQERAALSPKLDAMIARLDTGDGVSSPTPSITSETVERALRDAEVLIETPGATSGVDRLHTVLHGYLLAACESAGIAHPNDADMTAVMKLLIQQHPKLRPGSARAQDITAVLRSISAILAAFNPVRNRASVAHPNPKLLEQPEAMLVINAARTILHYVDAKLSA